MVAYAHFPAGLDLSVPVVNCFSLRLIVECNASKPRFEMQAQRRSAGRFLPKRISNNMLAGVIFAKVPAQGKVSMRYSEVFIRRVREMLTHSGDEAGSIIPKDWG